MAVHGRRRVVEAKRQVHFDATWQAPEREKLQPGITVHAEAESRLKWSVASTAEGRQPIARSG
jgi:hypothetical protein